MSEQRVTDVDFSKHELSTIKLDGIYIYKFERPDTKIDGVTFINACGVMTVTGDYGNWVFSREFHPSATGGVSRGYWDEKLEISSEQKSDKFDTDETKRAIESFKEEFPNYFGRDMNDEERDWVDSLERSVYDEYEYIVTAYREIPITVYADVVPFKSKRHYWLDAIYDAFNIMCDSLKEPNV